MKNKIKEIIGYLEYYKNRLYRYLINILNILPIKKNRVVFNSFNGRQYSCNPRALSEALHNINKNVEIIWAFNDPDRFRSIVSSDIRCVKMNSILYYILAKTSRVQIFNARGNGSLARRKGQIFIQTWHASNGYKKIYAKDILDKKRNKLVCEDYSYVMCGTKLMEKERVRGTMCFRGPIIKGTPRMDAMFGNNGYVQREKVLSSFSISNSKKIALYAPTYRSKREEDYSLDYKKTIETLSQTFGGEWILLVRLHYFVKRTGTAMLNCIDATYYPDMQELLIASDVLISDYSSCIWDFSFTYRPCFLYCPDLEYYSRTVNFNLPIKEWGFPISTDMTQLCKNIQDYNPEQFIANMKKHHSCMGSYEDGHATERALSIILDVIK